MTILELDVRVEYLRRTSATPVRTVEYSIGVVRATTMKGLHSETIGLLNLVKEAIEKKIGELEKESVVRND